MSIDNPPAFPVPDVYDPHGGGGSQGFPGMYLRDWFAGMALQGMNASLANTNDWPTQDAALHMSEVAYCQADAMLKERAKRTGT